MRKAQSLRQILLTHPRICRTRRQTQPYFSVAQRPVGEVSGFHPAPGRESNPSTTFIQFRQSEEINASDVIVCLIRPALRPEA